MKKLISKLFKKKKCYLPIYSFEELQKSYSISDSLKATILRANSGSIAAMHDLHRLFLEGKKAKKDLDLASYYLLAIVNNLELKTDDDVKLMCSVLLEIASVEKERKNYENMNKAFYDSSLLMVKNLPTAEWNFTVFDAIKESIQKQ